MKKWFVIALCAVLMLSFSGCGKKDKEASSNGASSTATNVTLQEVKKTSIADTATYTGEVKASDFVSISAKVSGNAVEVYKELGDYVEEGEILVKIDDTDYQIQYDQAQIAYNQAENSYNQAQTAYKQAESAYNQAQAAYDSAVASYNSVANGTAEQTKLQVEAALNAAKIEYNDAKTNHDNQKILYENGSISKAAYDAAVTRFENAKINLESAQKNYDLTTGVVIEENKTNAAAGVNSAKAGVESAKVGLESARTNVNSARIGIDSAQIQLDAARNTLENTVVRAPMAGYITSRNTNKGQMVAPGVEIFSVKSGGDVDVQINVTEAVIPFVNENSAAQIVIKAVNDKKIKGKVNVVSAAKDPQTGMYSVLVRIENKDGKIKDGMIADVSIALKESKSALVITNDAILEDEDGTKYVYVAKGDVAQRADIEVGIVTDDSTEILSGVTEGDKVIVSGKEYISEKNNSIKIVKE